MLSRLLWSLVGFVATLVALVSPSILPCAVAPIATTAIVLAITFAAVRLLAPHNAVEQPPVVAVSREPAAASPEPAPPSVHEQDYVAYDVRESVPEVSHENEPEAAWIRSRLPLGFHDAVDDFKRRLLAQAISDAGGNRAEAARRLGLQRTYLYRLTRQLSQTDAAN
jgi:DNA-binding NtrC family response regulator